MSNEIPQNPDVTYFGKTNYRGQEKMFGIKRRDRRQHMYVLGKSGTGKSVMLKNMIIQNIKNGEGLAVVDPHGELVEDILELIPDERKDDVIYFNPADTDFHIGFNVLEVPDPKYKHLIAAGLMSVFTKIWSNVWSARMEYIMNNCILALIYTPGSTMLGIPRLLVDQNYRQTIINNIKDPVVKAFWVNEYESWQERFRNEAIAPIQNKVGQFLSTSIVRNIIGQAKSTINIFDIMNNRKILLVNVSKGRIGEDNSALLGAMLITKIQLAAMERVRIPEEERKDFYLYVDEFQNFVTDAFAGILSEARKYRLCLCIAHQYIAQLETPESAAVRDAVFGNVGTMAIFRIGGADAEFIEQEFTPELEAQDFVNLPNYHVYLRLMVDGVTSRPFSASTLPPFKVEGSDNIARHIIQASRDNFTVAASKVEKEISDWTSGKPDDKDESDDIAENAENAKPDAQGNYRVRCSISDCKNIATVPFQPQKGRPVYCKNHIQKIKDGEVEPIKVKPHRNKAAQASMVALAGIGIAFDPKKFASAPEERKKPVEKNNKPKAKEVRRLRISKDTSKSPQSETGSGLKDILGSIFGNKNTQKESIDIPQMKKSEVRVTEVSAVIKPKPTISLSSLSERKPSLVSESNPRNNRIARPETQNSLAAALAAARKEETNHELKEIGLNALNTEEEPYAKPEDNEKLLQEAQELSERRARQARLEIKQERMKREQVEREKQDQINKLLIEEKKRKSLEKEAMEIRQRFNEIENEKRKIEQQMREKDANTNALRNEKKQLELERELLAQQKEMSDRRTNELEQDKIRIQKEKERLQSEKQNAENRATILERDNKQRNQNEAAEKSRKEVPQDILSKILE